MNVKNRVQSFITVSQLKYSIHKSKKKNHKNHIKVTIKSQLIRYMYICIKQKKKTKNNCENINDIQ